MFEIKKRNWSVVLKLRSPLQIGAGDIGMIEQTELYVPGRTLWGAFIATLTDMHWPELPEKQRPYKEVGKSITPALFSSFFLSEDKGSNVWLPFYKNNERMWKQAEYNFTKEKDFINTDNNSCKTESYIKSRFVYGITGNAISPDRMTSEDTMLFSTDTIMPQIQSDDGKSVLPVYLKGYCNLPEEISVSNKTVLLNKEEIERIFNSMRIGGSRKRGRGIVIAEGIKQENGLSAIFNRLVIGVDKIVLLDSSTKVDEKYEIESGKAVLAVNRIYGSSNGHTGYGHGFVDNSLCWDTGTIIKAPIEPGNN